MRAASRTVARYARLTARIDGMSVTGTATGARLTKGLLCLDHSRPGGAARVCQPGDADPMKMKGPLAPGGFGHIVVDCASTAWPISVEVRTQ